MDDRIQGKLEKTKERVYEYIKSVLTVRKFFLDNFSIDPPVINGDQMPLHRNESASQKTLNIQGCDTYVKENYSLSRERVTHQSKCFQNSTSKAKEHASNFNHQLV